MAMGNVELVQESFLKHLGIGTAIMMTDKKCKNRGLTVERSKAGTKTRSPRRKTIAQAPVVATTGSSA